MLAYGRSRWAVSQKPTFYRITLHGAIFYINTFFDSESRKKKKKERKKENTGNIAHVALLSRALYPTSFNIRNLKKLYHKRCSEVFLVFMRC